MKYLINFKNQHGEYKIFVDSENTIDIALKYFLIKAYPAYKAAYVQTGNPGEYEWEFHDRLNGGCEIWHPGATESNTAIGLFAIEPFKGMDFKSTITWQEIESLANQLFDMYDTQESYYGKQRSFSENAEMLNPRGFKQISH
jgi:hypothetical protein